jgi:non-ribosomal peptide synthetase component F/thioesterase domain-containing protein/acyl carrier protein
VFSFQRLSEQSKAWERRSFQGVVRPAVLKTQFTERAAAAEFESLEWLEDGKHPLDWNGPDGRVFTRFRDEDLNRPIIDQFERVTLRHRNRIAVTDSDTSLSFGELWDGLSGLAETIAAETRPGDLIGIVLPTCSMFPVAALACLAAGRPFVALDPHYPGSWLGQVLEDARPALIIGREEVLRGIDTGAPTTRVIHLTRLPRAARKGWRPAEPGMDQPACVVFTSGSTGRAKGIVNSQRNLLQRVSQSINAAHVNADDRFLTLASLCTIVGVRDLITALLAGASVHLLDTQRAGAREILHTIRAEAVTIVFAFPGLLRSVIAYGGGRAGDALRLVRVGGDTTLWSDIDLLRAWLGPEPAIQLIYAATEAPMMQWFVDDFCRADDARIPIGYPLPGNRLALIDENGRNTPPGEVGELVVASPYVALGLWVEGRCAAGSIESGLENGLENNGASPRRLFRTGDLVRQRPDGLLDRIGRKDRQVKIRGTRVDLDGVEAVLRRHPFVRDVAALARPAMKTSGADGEVNLVAYVCPRDGAPAGILDDLKDLMRSAPPPMRPGRLYLAHEIPRLPSSKPDLRALMALDEVNVQYESPRVAAAAVADPAGDDCIARTVAQVWQEVLQMSVGRPEDDFFEFGGDSLKAIRVMMALERALGLELSLTLITETPKFARFCEALREHRTTRYVPLVRLKPGDGSPPVFIIHGLDGNVAGLFPMSRRMTCPGAVIGIQARGLAGEDPPHATVEAMAAEYLREVKTRQPGGPYYLCGYSFGGLVAFEMARRLRESGDEVALVGLFDTTMSPLTWGLRSWLSIVGRRVVKFASGAVAAPVHTWPALVRKVARGACEGLRGFWKSTPTRVLRVAAVALMASARYRPGFYAGELTLFTPVKREPGLPSPEAIWRKHARALSIVETAGAHSTMFSAPNAESTAASLTRCLLVCSARTSASSAAPHSMAVRSTPVTTTL